MTHTTCASRREDQRGSTVVIAGADASDYAVAKSELKHATYGAIVLRDTSPGQGPSGFVRQHLLPWIRRADIVHIDLWPYHLPIEDIYSVDIETEVGFAMKDEPWRWTLYIATLPQFLPEWLAIVARHNRDAAVTVIRGKGDSCIETFGRIQARNAAGFPERSDLDFPERRA